METLTTDLQIDYKGVPITVSKHLLKSTEIFRVVFSDQRLPLIITIAKKESGRNFWTSVPQGRLREAEQIGDLITNHFKLF